MLLLLLLLRCEVLVLASVRSNLHGLLLVSLLLLETWLPLPDKLLLFSRNAVFLVLYFLLV